jgi:hypothetical protein
MSAGLRHAIGTLKLTSQRPSISNHCSSFQEGNLSRHLDICAFSQDLRSAGSFQSISLYTATEQTSNLLVHHHGAHSGYNHCCHLIDSAIAFFECLCITNAGRSMGLSNYFLRCWFFENFCQNDDDYHYYDVAFGPSRSALGRRYSSTFTAAARGTPRKRSCESIGRQRGTFR